MKAEKISRRRMLAAAMPTAAVVALAGTAAIGAPARRTRARRPASPRVEIGTVHEIVVNGEVVGWREMAVGRPEDRDAVQSDPSLAGFAWTTLGDRLIGTRLRYA